MTDAAMPPYSLGHGSAIQPRSASFFWNCFAKSPCAAIPISLSASNCSSQPEGSSLRRNSLTSVRNPSSSSLNRKSMGPPVRYALKGLTYSPPAAPGVPRGVMFLLPACVKSFVPHPPPRRGNGGDPPDPPPL